MRYVVFHLDSGTGLRPVVWAGQPALAGGALGRRWGSQGVL